MSKSNAQSPNGAGASFTDQVEVVDVGPCHLLLMPTTVQDVVSWYGSIRTNPDFAAEEELLQELAVGLLDKGTKHRDRFAVAEILENRGAELNFSSEGLNVQFSGRALSAHLAEVFRILAEQLREPLLDAGEFEKARARLAASLHRELERTGSQASGALSRRIYRPAHPNYTPPTREMLGRLEVTSVDAVRAYHAGHFGANRLTLVVVGDFDVEEACRAVGEAFGGWPQHASAEMFEGASRPEEPGRSEVEMPGKRNIDVRMGHGLPVLRQDADYIPLFLGNYVLGGNFSARLMTTIRDEMGLTYGIGSSFKGITTEVEGHWQIDVTLSQENIAPGLEAITELVRSFVEAGISQEELDAVKQTVTGSFKVGLATTRGLANVLHLNELRGFGPEYLDRFPEEVSAVTVDEVNAVIQKYFDPERFQLALAGGLAREEAAPLEEQ